MTDEPFDLLPRRPFAVDRGVVSPGDIRDKHRFSGPCHVREFSLGIQWNPVVRAVDPAPIGVSFQGPSSARAHMQRRFLAGACANGAVGVLIEKPDPSQGNMLVGHDGFDYLPEDRRRVCRLSD
jgi:hypothetical protein